MTIPQEQILLQGRKKRSAKVGLQLSFEETSRSGCGLLALSGSCLAVLFYSLNRRGWSVWR